MAKQNWLENYYTIVKIIAITFGSLISIALAPFSDFWKGFLSAGLLFSFIWLLVYFRYNPKSSKRNN